MSYFNDEQNLIFSMHLVKKFTLMKWKKTGLLKNYDRTRKYFSVTNSENKKETEKVLINEEIDSKIVKELSIHLQYLFDDKDDNLWMINLTTSSFVNGKKTILIDEKRPSHVVDEYYKISSESVEKLSKFNKDMDLDQKIVDRINDEIEKSLKIEINNK